MIHIGSMYGQMLLELCGYITFFCTSTVVAYKTQIHVMSVLPDLMDGVVVRHLQQCIDKNDMKMVTLTECISKITNEVENEGQDLESPRFTDEKDW
jgi:hypothetical protein